MPSESGRYLWACACGKGVAMRPDDIVERRLDNGWYELSTLAYSMGEEYRESKRYDHKPNNTDYRKFIDMVEHNR
jgi:hypothetical protein